MAIASVGKERNWVAVLRRVMDSAWWGRTVTHVDTPPIALNDEWLTVVNAAGTGAVNVLRVNTSNEIDIGISGQTVNVGGDLSVPFYKTVTFRSGQGSVGTAGPRSFWIADSTYTVVGITESHAVAETTATTDTGTIRKRTATATLTDLMTNSFNLKGTADTVQSATLSAVSGATTIAAGDRLEWVNSTTSTQLAGVTVVVTLAPGNRNNQATFYGTGVALADSVFFIANRPVVITRVDYVHTVAASAASNVQLVIDTGTDAPGAGTDVLTNNSSAGFDCNATANTVQNGTFTAGTRLAAGNRLSVDFSGTITGLAGMVLTVTFAPAEDLKDVTISQQANGTHIDANFFIADRPYYVYAASAVWSTAASSGNTQLVIATGTTAIASGTDLIALDTAAGFQHDATANTVEIGTFISEGVRYMGTGDRLGLDFATITSLVGFVCTVTLKPA